jgi:hypothetical protein
MKDLLSPHVKGELKRFGLDVLNTIKFVLNRGEGNKAFEGEDLLYAIDRIAVLIKALVLKELGFSEDRIRRHAGRVAKVRI